MLILSIPVLLGLLHYEDLLSFFSLYHPLLFSLFQVFLLQGLLLFLLLLLVVLYHHLYSFFTIMGLLLVCFLWLMLSLSISMSNIRYLCLDILPLQVEYMLYLSSNLILGEEILNLFHLFSWFSLNHLVLVFRYYLYLIYLPGLLLNLSLRLLMQEYLD